MIGIQEKTDSSARSVPRNDKILSFPASCEAYPTCGRDLLENGFHHRIGGASGPKARGGFAEGVEKERSRFVAEDGIGKSRHHFFEAAGEFEGGDHRVERVAVARIGDILQNIHGFVFEFG